MYSLICILSDLGYV
ncbi:hypothetical protein F383_02341 [Gossypium arboreum]|uniref:Uncharacterized protein n=1 Tax=Gossypium arboreum TaxID=29729 RepID=A0A0B0P8X1_GOSAR|nr:hypothetical protein F383_02341 [Gossypium arboreum]